MGDSGSGFAVKAVNNMLLAANLWATAEGFTTLKANGVNLNNALECINASSGKSAVTEMILPQRILNREFPLTFALSKYEYSLSNCVNNSLSFSIFCRCVSLKPIL